MCKLYCFISLIIASDAARILGVFPTPSISHQVVFNAYCEELLKNGHELVLVSPNPFNSSTDSKNLTVIDLNYMYDDKESILNPMLSYAKRGVIADMHAVLDSGSLKHVIHLIVGMFEHPEVAKLIEDKNQKFDLIVVEAFMNYHLILSKIFNAPVILLSSYHGMPDNLDVVGAVGRHPLLYPNTLRSKFKYTTFFDKLEFLHLEYKMHKAYKDFEKIENSLLRKKFGPDAPSIHELKDNVHLLFLNSNPIFTDNRPVPPNTVYLGALHLKPVKELPQDLKEYLDGSKRGVVYVSFGSNVAPSMMSTDFLDAFLDAFEALPYDVLWKFDAELNRQPKNLKIHKWFPQRDLLTHPNVKVFVTQGGLQSTDESIDAGVPLVGIPIHGDQWFNINKYVELGIGEHVDGVTMTADDLVRAINKVIGDSRYKENIKRLKTIINDQPMRPMERAIWWTEHLLRHGGTKHYRPPSANMLWSEYLMLDVVIPILLTLFGMLLVIIAIFICIVRSILRVCNKTKVKQN